MFYIILIILIKCYRIKKDGRRDLFCGVELMSFGIVFKEELIFKLVFEKLLEFC